MSRFGGKATVVLALVHRLGVDQRLLRRWAYCDLGAAVASSGGCNREGAWGRMLFRARFVTRPDLDSDDFEPTELLTFLCEIDYPQEGTR